MFGLPKQFLQHVVPSIVKPLHILWNEIIGFVFVSLAVIAGFRTFSFYNAAATDADQGVRMIFSGVFTLVMLYFGVSSFWKAKKIGKS